MEENYSEKIEEILKEAKKELDSLLNKYNEGIKPIITGEGIEKVYSLNKFEKMSKENFEKYQKFLPSKISSFCVAENALKKSSEDYINILKESIETQERSIESQEEIIALMEKSIHFSEEHEDLDLGSPEKEKESLEEEKESLEENKESLHSDYERLFKAYDDLDRCERMLSCAETFDFSKFEYISIVNFPKKCDEWLKAFEEDLNFKKETECKELLTKDADNFVREAIEPLEDEFAKIYVVGDLYCRFWSDKCYVATAVYGSYDCPQVWTLRRYRDNELAKTWFGRAFIHTYYAISPTIIRYFGDTKWFKNMWRVKLDRMVKDLQARGFEDTPYNDREW